MDDRIKKPRTDSATADCSCVDRPGIVHVFGFLDSANASAFIQSKILHFQKSGLGRILGCLCGGIGFRLTIPSNIDDCRVEAVCGFINCEVINEVVIPDSVHTIDGFWDCRRLRKITFGNGLRHIRENAFGWCEDLERIRIPRTCLDVGWLDLRGCKKLKLVSLPANAKLTSLSVCDSVKISFVGRCVGRYRNYMMNAFTIIEDVERHERKIVRYTGHERILNIPDGVTEIDLCVFDGNKALEQVCFPASLQVIGCYAFRGCSSLKKVEFNAFGGVRVLGYGSFDGCKSIESIKLPNSVEEIQQYAFRGCEGLAVVDMSEAAKLRHIDEMVFAGCTEKDIRLIMPQNPEKCFRVQKTDSGVRILKPQPILKRFGRKRYISSAEDGAVDY